MSIDQLAVRLVCWLFDVDPTAMTPSMALCFNGQMMVRSEHCNNPYIVSGGMIQLDTAVHRRIAMVRQTFAGIPSTKPEERKYWRRHHRAFVPSATRAPFLKRTI